MPDVTFFLLMMNITLTEIGWVDGVGVSNFYGLLLKIIQIFPTSIELLFDFHNAPALKRTPI